MPLLYLCLYDDHSGDRHCYILKSSLEWFYLTLYNLQTYSVTIPRMMERYNVQSVSQYDYYITTDTTVNTVYTYSHHLHSLYRADVTLLIVTVSYHPWHLSNTTITNSLQHQDLNFFSGSVNLPSNVIFIYLALSFLFLFPSKFTLYLYTKGKALKFIRNPAVC